MTSMEIHVSPGDQCTHRRNGDRRDKARFPGLSRHIRSDRPTIVDPSTARLPTQGFRGRGECEHAEGVSEGLHAER
jgi:hypothetical protein